MRKDLHAHSPFGKLLGSEIVRVDSDAGEIEIHYEARPEFTNRMGTVAGGMLAAMLDGLTGLAGLAVLSDDTRVATTSLSVEYLRPAPADEPIVGLGRVVERDERDLRTRGELRNGVGQVVARGEATLRILRRRTHD
jgi:uncharacterized protein (TIGR00369 family)